MPDDRGRDYDQERRDQQNRDTDNNTRSVERIADAAAAKAVDGAFRMLGIDTKDIESVNDLRDDFRFMRTLRKDAQERHGEINKTVITVLTGAVTGIIGTVGGYLWSMIHGGPGAPHP